MKHFEIHFHRNFYRVRYTGVVETLILYRSVELSNYESYYSRALRAQQTYIIYTYSYINMNVP